MDGDLISVKSQNVRQRGLVSRFSCTTKAILSGTMKIFFFETGQTIIGSPHNFFFFFFFFGSGEQLTGKLKLRGCVGAQLSTYIE